RVGSRNSLAKVVLRGIEAIACRRGTGEAGERIRIVWSDRQRLEIVLVGERGGVGFHLHRRAMAPVQRGRGGANRGNCRRQLRLGGSGAKAIDVVTLIPPVDGARRGV